MIDELKKSLKFFGIGLMIQSAFFIVADLFNIPILSLPIFKNEDVAFIAVMLVSSIMVSFFYWKGFCYLLCLNLSFKKTIALLLTVLFIPIFFYTSIILSVLVLEEVFFKPVIFK